MSVKRSRKIKILHLTAVRALTPGQRKQLKHEDLASRQSGLHWHTVALHTEVTQNEFEIQIPKAFRSIILRQIYGWLFAIRNASKYDLILMRALPLDILGPLLGLFVRNRFTVHHGKELEELPLIKHRGAAAIWVATAIERYIKPLTMKSAHGLAGVSGDIRDYEVSRFPHLREQAIVLPNGYYFAGTEPVKDFRRNDVVTFTFVCGRFTEWHGLDRLLEALKGEAGSIHKPITVHLVGTLTDAQKSEIDELTLDNVELIAHGVLGTEKVRSLLAESDVAIGSLALDRQNLHEGSTLKVREYLASGIPVYATHSDTSLSANFPYFYEDSSVSITNLMDFAEFTALHSRNEVRVASEPFLDKERILETVMQQLDQLSKVRATRNGARSAR